MGSKSEFRHQVFFLCIVVSIISKGCEKELYIAESQPIKDIEGNVYKTVQIGTQVWMAENLKTKCYSNGDLIGTTTPATLYIQLEKAPKYQWAYDGDDNNAAVYGRLYSGYAITDNRNVCPTGWHIPTSKEWTRLVNYLGSENLALKLKETGTSHWLTTNDGTNESGFTALPGGQRYDEGLFVWKGYSCIWWAALENPSTWAYEFSISIHSPNSNIYSTPNSYGLSVRCIKD